MPWTYSDVAYCPDVRADKPYVVTARECGSKGNLWTEIKAHGATPGDARRGAEEGARQMDRQAHLLPWKCE